METKLNRNHFLKEDSIKDIRTVIHLKWYKNIHGRNKVKEYFNISVDRLDKILKIHEEDIEILKYLNDKVELDLKLIRLSVKKEVFYNDDYYDEENDDDNYIDVKASYYDDDYDLTKEHKIALQKNDDLVYQLSEKRDNFLGIGTNKTKRRLNKLSQTDDIAMALRIALEIEDKNISAKKSFGKYRERYYIQKSDLINSLIDLFEIYKWNYGIEKKSEHLTNSIIYFDIPNCEQISWHTNLNCKDIPIYNQPWDGKINSTLNKLEDCIKNLYSSIIY